MTVPDAAREKLKICLLDFFACAFEAHVLPWARQAAALATAGAGPCRIIGTELSVPAGDAVFANSVAGHGLVREDMHTGSVSHLGIVVLPPLLALAEERKVDGGNVHRGGYCRIRDGRSHGPSAGHPRIRAHIQADRVHGSLRSRRSLGTYSRISTKRRQAVPCRLPPIWLRAEPMAAYRRR